MTTRGSTRRRSLLAWLAGLLVVAAACSSPAAPASAGSSGTPPPPSNLPSPEPTSDQPSPDQVGHYSIDVANVGGGHHFGGGHNEADGDVACTHLVSTGEWLAHGVYLPDQPGDAGRDVLDLTISNAPGHEWVATSIKGDPSDSVEGWSVMTGTENPTITITANDQVHPLTITGVADDNSQPIKILATCSHLDETP